MSEETLRRAKTSHARLRARKAPGRGTADQSWEMEERRVSHKKEFGFLLSALGPVHPNPSPHRGTASLSSILPHKPSLNACLSHPPLPNFRTLWESPHFHPPSPAVLENLSGSSHLQGPLRPSQHPLPPMPRPALPSQPGFREHRGHRCSGLPPFMQPRQTGASQGTRPRNGTDRSPSTTPLPKELGLRTKRKGVHSSPGAPVTKHTHVAV